MLFCVIESPLHHKILSVIMCQQRFLSYYSLLFPKLYIYIYVYRFLKYLKYFHKLSVIMYIPSHFCVSLVPSLYKKVTHYQSWFLKDQRKCKAGPPAQGYFTSHGFLMYPVWYPLNFPASFPIWIWQITAIMIYLLWVHTVNYHLIVIKNLSKRLDYIAYARPALSTNIFPMQRTRSLQV